MFLLHIHIQKHFIDKDIVNEYGRQEMFFSVVLFNTRITWHGFKNDILNTHEVGIKLYHNSRHNNTMFFHHHFKYSKYVIFNWKMKVGSGWYYLWNGRKTTRNIDDSESNITNNKILNFISMYINGNVW